MLVQSRPKPVTRLYASNSIKPSRPQPPPQPLGSKQNINASRRSSNSQNWRGLSPMLKRGLLYLSLLPFLSSCKTITVSEPVYPPSHLTIDCRNPEFVGDTTGDLVRHIVDQDAAIAECTGRMRALKEWRGE